MPHPSLKKIAYNPYSSKRPRPQVRYRRPRWRWIGPLIIIGLFLAVAGFTLALGLVAWYSRDLPDPSNLSRRMAQASTKIYDRTGQTLLYEISGDQKSTPIKLADLPSVVKNATLVAEDRDFYSHRGFDLKGIARALLVDLLRGGRVQGGSTITQQLVKNTIVGGEKTWRRKIQELILSYRIEQRFSKDQILEMYFNSIPYGGSAYGIEAAANMYFKKSAKDLSPAEAVLLAALPKAPSYLSPYGSHRDELLARQRYVIEEMAKLGYFSPSEAEAAKTGELKFVPFKEGILAPHFVFYVKELLSEQFGERLVETGGLKIITTLDLYKQKIAEEEVAAGAAKNEKKYGGNNAALVALDPKNGQVLAMVGSRDYFAEEYDGNVNVTLRPRQPGSSFKPIVYATAFMRGYAPETILYDVVTTFKTDTKDYTPHNYDGQEHGPVSIRQALAGSLNIPAVKTLYLAGVDNVLDLAARLGYTTFDERSRFGLSLVLGGGEVKLLEHTAAFQAFARDGVYNPTTPILRVEDSHGQVLASFEPNPQTILPQNVARQITSIISDNVSRSFIFGSQSPLVLGDRPIAAKTGTTNDWHDGWTIGYTPSLVAGVWAGNNNNKAMARGADGVLVAAPIWNAFMKRVLGDTPQEVFVQPDPVLPEKPILRGVLVSEEKVVIDRASGKRATELTPASYREEKTYKELHEILHYVKRDDPLGPPPENPADDPNYASWETALARWAKENNLAGGELAPQEYDDLHTLASQPQLTITAPVTGETIRGQSLSVKISASAPRGLKGIKYYLDGSLLGEISGTGELEFLVPLSSASTSTGFHTLRLEAFDDIDNTRSEERLFNYIP